MKARIFVTLMIILSMCMVSAATQEEEHAFWHGEGKYDGEKDGFGDGYEGNEYSFFGMSYPSGCLDEFKDFYEDGYQSGYDVGYDDGVDKAEEDANPNNATKTKPENCMSAPAMGLGLRLPDGTVTQKGDQLPTLYTWAKVDDKYEHHTTLTFPIEGTHTGCVIITPPQIAGEPLVPSGFWDTPKGQRILQWKANAK